MAAWGTRAEGAEGLVDREEEGPATVLGSSGRRAMPETLARAELASETKGHSLEVFKSLPEKRQEHKLRHRKSKLDEAENANPKNLSKYNISIKRLWLNCHQKTTH